MIKETFKEEAEELIDKFEDLIEYMPDKGNTEYESQKLVLRNRLSSLSYAVNGVEDEDFIEDED